MSMVKRINAVRRALLRGFVRKMGAAHVDPKMDANTSVKKILICRPNHRLGNLLLMTPLVQEVIATFPGCEIDLFVKGGLGEVIFERYDNVRNLIQLPKKPQHNIRQYIRAWRAIKSNQYDLVINVVRQSFSGKLSVQLAHSTYKFFGAEDHQIQTQYSDHRHVAKYPVYNLRHYLEGLGFPVSHRPIETLDLKLSDEELQAGKTALQDIVKNDKKTLCIFTFATGAKCYSPDWWEVFYARLKAEFSDYNIVEVLPVENVSQISFQAPSYYSKDVRAIGGVIAAADIFIGADSGIMHLASAVKARTVGLFCVTDASNFEPYGNHGVSINTNETNIDDWILTIKSVLQAE
jgi:heptosyltransferase III